METLWHVIEYVAVGWLLCCLAILVVCIVSALRVPKRRPPHPPVHPWVGRLALPDVEARSIKRRTDYLHTWVDYDAEEHDGSSDTDEAEEAPNNILHFDAAKTEPHIAHRLAIVKRQHEGGKW